jgi:heparin binding hemagglutinin HbhA
MTHSNDFATRAQAAIEKIADRMPELPRPVLAAIGAADLAGRQLTDLIGRIGERTGIKAPTMPHRDDVVGELRATATDLPAKLQQFAGELPQKVQELIAELPAKAKELADELEQFATGLPGRVQKFSDELPGRVSEVGTQLQPEHVKQSAEAYGQLISTVFATLAERGEHTWSDLRNNGPVAGSVVDAEAEKPASEKPVAEKAAPAKAGTAKAGTAKTTAKPRPARRKPAAPAADSAAATAAGTAKKKAASATTRPRTRPGGAN